MEDEFGLLTVSELLSYIDKQVAGAEAEIERLSELIGRKVVYSNDASWEKGEASRQIQWMRDLRQQKYEIERLARLAKTEPIRA